MACPLFIPTAPLGDLVRVGELFAGHCADDPSANIDADVLRRHCNFGYARGSCERAAKSGADAVRLMVRGRKGTLVEIAWSLERDHHPVGVGRIDVETTNEPSGDALAHQAHASATAYMRQIAATAHP